METKHTNSIGTTMKSLINSLVITPLKTLGAEFKKSPKMTTFYVVFTLLVATRFFIDPFDADEKLKQSEQAGQTTQVEQTISDYEQNAYIMCKIAIEDALTVSYEHLNLYDKNMIVISNGDRSNSRVAFSMKVKVNGDMRTTRASCKLNQLNVTKITLV